MEQQQRSRETHQDWLWLVEATRSACQWEFPCLIDTKGQSAEQRLFSAIHYY